MKRLLTSFLLFIAVFPVCVGQKTAKKKQEVDFVNTYIGTAKNGAGGLIPSVGPPFAMTNFSAQTCENRINRMPYLYEDSTIMSFIATHQPTVWMGDYGYVSMMSVIGELKVLPEQRKLKFSHDDETVSPYYYSVKMKAAPDKIIMAEIAATERCGMFRFTFPQSKEAHIVVQALNVNPSATSRLNEMEAYIRVNHEWNEITGYNPDRFCLDLGPRLKNFKGYFVIQFDKRFDSFGTWNNDSIYTSPELYGKQQMGAFISFATKKNEAVKVKVATSFISIDQARENMRIEMPDWNFERIAAATRQIWQENLERIKIEGVTDEQRTIFYSAFYRCLLFPRVFSEYGQYYSAFDDQIHEGISYNDFSLWDTFRALHPFLIFAQPERVNDMITAMLQMYKEGGWLPMWPNPAETNIMIGTHADAVIADAYVKGFRGYDVELAYEAMRKNAMMPTECDVPSNKFRDRQHWSCYEGRAGLNFYHALGYVPSDYKSESVSRTLEYALDDYCIAQVAKEMGKTSDYEKFMRWSQNYKNLYNKETGFMAPRLFNGEWDTNTKEGFTEGSPWTYLFCVMQDVPGLIELMGGNELFAKKLDQNFNDGHYRHSNEPGHHYIYLYSYSGEPWKTQELIRKHTRVNYRNLPNGINGNDDCGQMSTWYIFSVMGFYPVTPASGVYAIGAPQFPKITMNYKGADEKQRKLEIVANNLSEENKYIQSVTLDGNPITKPFISHQNILDGVRLVFEMGPEPNYKWK